MGQPPDPKNGSHVEIRHVGLSSPVSWNEPGRRSCRSAIIRHKTPRRRVSFSARRFPFLRLRCKHTTPHQVDMTCRVMRRRPAGPAAAHRQGNSTILSHREKSLQTRHRLWCSSSIPPCDGGGAGANPVGRSFPSISRTPENKRLSIEPINASRVEIGDVFFTRQAEVFNLSETVP